MATDEQIHPIIRLYQAYNYQYMLDLFYLRTMGYDEAIQVLTDMFCPYGFSFTNQDFNDLSEDFNIFQGIYSTCQRHGLNVAEEWAAYDNHVVRVMTYG